MSDPLGLVGGAGGFRPGGPTGPGGPGAIGPGMSGGSDGPKFVEELAQQIEEVNLMQQDAAKAAEDLVAGRRDDIEGVMIATEKAGTAFQMLLAVRNKMLDAYDEVKNLRV